MADQVQTFIDRWSKSGAAERANYQLFLAELCDLLEVPRPDPATPDTSLNTYVFERAVVFRYGDGTSSNGRIDLYKRGSFVLEAKQGAEYPQTGQDAPLSTVVRDQNRRVGRGIGSRGTPAWDEAMLRARGQAEQYVRALPAEEGRPPFIIVADVGHSLELYSEFSRSGGAYVPFPAPGSHRIHLEDLKIDEIRDRLRAVWTDPLSLDPTRRSAQVTREIADRLAKLAVALEKGGHDPHETAGFLMRCLFTMFAEDVGLLPKSSFSEPAGQPEGHPRALRADDRGALDADECRRLLDEPAFRRAPVQWRPIREGNRAAPHPGSAAAAGRGGQVRLAGRGAGDLRHAA